MMRDKSRFHQEIIKKTVAIVLGRCIVDLSGLNWLGWADSPTSAMTV
jgi:hypothetical protein